MRNIYKENIKNLMLNILQKNEKEVIKIKAMPKELKMQVATDINELLNGNKVNALPTLFK